MGCLFNRRLQVAICRKAGQERRTSKKAGNELSGVEVTLKGTTAKDVTSGFFLDRAGLTLITAN